MRKIPTRKCLNCKKRFEVKSDNHVLCGFECYSVYQHNQQKKKRLQEEKKQKQEKAVEKEKSKTLTQYKTEAKQSFQKYIRLRDQDQPCISCGKYNCTDWAGGHYFPAGVYSGMVFDERNCHKQCNSHCNKFRNGNLIEYRIGLVNRYGVEYVEQLESDAIKRKDYKYTKQELIAKRLQYDLKCKEFKKH